MSDKNCSRAIRCDFCQTNPMFWVHGRRIIYDSCKICTAKTALQKLHCKHCTPGTVACKSCTRQPLSTVTSHPTPVKHKNHSVTESTLALAYGSQARCTAARLQSKSSTTASIEKRILFFGASLFEKQVPEDFAAPPASPGSFFFTNSGIRILLLSFFFVFGVCRAKTARQVPFCAVSAPKTPGFVQKLHAKAPNPRFSCSFRTCSKTDLVQSGFMVDSFYLP